MSLKPVVRLPLALAICIPLIAGQRSGPVAKSPQAVEFFENRIRPLFAKKCFACHTDARSGGLRLDSRESILQGGDSGPAIVPGHPEQSLLIQAVSYTHERLKMPPPGKLPDAAIAELKETVTFAWPRRLSSCCSMHRQ